MKNRIQYIFLSILLSNFIFFSASSVEQFNFNVTEIEILNDGNKIKGKKKGTVETDDGIIIKADNFLYNKLSNILEANGNVEIIDTNKSLKVYSDFAVYEKNYEIITTTRNSKAIYGDGKFIYANSFKLDRNKGTLNAKDDVKIENILDNYLITGNDFTYFEISKKIITNGEAKAFIQSKYEITSSDVTYLINENILTSKKKTKIKDKKSQVYFLEKFNYQINQEILKGEKIILITNHNLPKSDKFFFESAIINLKEQKFIAKNTEIDLHKDIFDNSDNDPRLKGVSSVSDSNITEVRKGIFTSCKKNDDCPPWSLTAKKITHNKKKKQLLYNDAILKVHDFPVMYYPIFFHPDPSVKRQSGLLKPEINNSNILGNSLTLPYFKVISENKDVTLTPTIFNSNTLMSTAEYRQINKSSKIFADFGFVNGYKSSTTKKKNSLSHLFFKYDLDLDLENYNSSGLELSLERVSNDKYLKIFDTHITKSTLRPDNFDKLNSNIKMYINDEKFNFTSGIQSYENLQIKNRSDRYSYSLPYYNFDKLITQNYLSGNINFNSSGSNNLDETNKIESSIINNINYNSLDFISKLGLKTNYGISLNNLNSVGKKTSKYKSSPQVDLVGLFNADLSLPLSKKGENYNNVLTPKLSFRFNPTDMKDKSTSNNKINIDNIFALNRLGLSDTLEAGRSMTLGLDFKKEKKDDLKDINNYFEMKLATVLRDKEEKFIPKKSSIHQKNSNLFGSITNRFSNNFDLGYNFAIDNDYSTFEYNDLNATISVNKFTTKFNFIEENDTNVLANSIAYNFNDKNFFKFQTRRNRKINLTEFYDLVYEYKNDCLTAGIKYKKSYYSDGDLKPTENLLFTISLIPLTNYEYSANEILSK